MPSSKPSQSWTEIRTLTEKFEWTDTRTGIRVTGMNPPHGAKDVKRKPFYIRYITGKGIVEEGVVTCIRVDPYRHMRRVRYEQSREIRWVRDYLIIEIDGIRIVTH